MKTEPAGSAYETLNRAIVARELRYEIGTNTPLSDLIARMETLEKEAQRELDEANVPLGRHIRNLYVGGRDVTCFLERVGRWQGVSWWLPEDGEETLLFMGRYDVPRGSAISGV